MDLFGQNILDFPNDGCLFDQLSPVSPGLGLSETEDLKAHYLSETENLKADQLPSALPCLGLAETEDIEGYLNTAVSLEQVCKVENVKTSEDVSLQSLDSLSFDEMMAEPPAANLGQEAGELPDCTNMFDIFNQIEALQLISNASSEIKPNLDCTRVEPDSKKDCQDQLAPCTELDLKHEEVEEDSEESFDYLLKSIFEVPGQKSQKTEDLISSILSSDDGIDPEYFDNFDIDSVEDSVVLKKEPEVKDVPLAGVFSPREMRDHDYTVPSLPVSSLPVSSLPARSLFFTPPPSPGEESEGEKCLAASRPLQTSAVRPLQSRQGRQLPPSRESVIAVPVIKKVRHVSARSILKKRPDVSDQVNKSRNALQSILKKTKLKSSKRAHKSKIPRDIVREVVEQTIFDSWEGEFGEFGNTKKKKASGHAKKLDSEREVHNSKERQRRIEMNEAFECLKDAIPTIDSSSKASKLKILTSATDYCRGLEGKLQRLEAIQYQEQDRRRDLRERLHILQLQY